MKMSFKQIVFTLLCIFGGIIITTAQNSIEAPSWIDFCKHKEAGDMQNSVLLDYSYAGYHFSEKALPDVSTWNTISVQDYGAIPNDGKFDDAEIQAAINAAGQTGIPTVVYFPKGRYMVGSETTKDIPIKVNYNNIVLKGAGSDGLGTEIHAVNYGNTTKRWNTPWRFVFKPSRKTSKQRSSSIARIKSPINRGDKIVHVTDAKNISVGMLVTLKGRIKKQHDVNLSLVGTNPEWNLINKKGISISEKHVVTHVKGNKVTFKNPINFPIGKNGDQFKLYTFKPITEVGLEDMLFTSAWKDYPEEFVHHANDIVDYAWRAVFFEDAYNSYIRNVKFRDWNDCIQIRNSFATTVKNIEISGKRGHASFLAYQSTGVLIEKSKDLVSAKTNRAGGQRHGPAFQKSSTGCVYRNIELQKNQPADCHGYYSYGNLLDNVYGGTFDRNGGAKRAYPNSGPDLLFWNFVHASDFNTMEFDFWNLKKHTLHTYLKPKFVGFTSPNEEISFKNEGLDEVRGSVAYPKSLFRAQLHLRLYGVHISASSEKVGFEAENLLNKNKNDYWIPNIKDNEDVFLILDFGKTKAVSGIGIQDAYNKIKNFSVEYYVNDSWLQVKKTKNTLTNDEWKLDNSINTRKIKLIFDKVEQNAIIKLSKVEVL